MAAAERIGRGGSGGDPRPLDGGDETPDNAGEVPAGADPFDVDARLDVAGDRDAEAVAEVRDVESDRRRSPGIATGRQGGAMRRQREPAAAGMRVAALPPRRSGSLHLSSRRTSSGHPRQRQPDIHQCRSSGTGKSR